jgi:hypothetical protein
MKSIQASQKKVEENRVIGFKELLAEIGINKKQL